MTKKVLRIQRNRSIAGKRFRWVTYRETKAKADAVANNLRLNGGGLARVIKTAPGRYDIWEGYA